jgi:hypothetical protein
MYHDLDAEPTTIAAALEGLLTDRLRVLGSDQPDTLAARHNLPQRRGETSGQFAAPSKKLLTDQYGPSTQTTTPWLLARPWPPEVTGLVLTPDGEAR